ncbi:peptide transporter [Nautilia sp. PV-1]|uniref:STT3 domain-containing protein n=1 Tax=Nautilia sp. PV-1 TaxID=2579250 RepID=UPI000FDC499F|nr:STT3 domain-containing protein [Nautilia sp. PV-1]AZV47314.1 peptide transporter [Nautilia sp. PV-1]
MKENLNIQEIRFSNKIAFFMILTAYIFSIVVRLYYYNWASHIKEFLWHGTLMINNVDGYSYAAGAKEFLNHSHIIGDLNPYHSLPSIITALFVKIFPFLTLDQVILWLPTVFGSLVVIPLFLIGRSLKNDILGFIAAMIGGIVWSYYNRSMIGYYDTDMLVIPLLVFVFWGLVEFFVNDNKKMMWIVPLIVVFYEGWYPGCRTVLLAIVAFAFVYAYFFKREKQSFLFLTIVMITLSKFPYYINLLIFIVLYIAVLKKEVFFTKKNIWFLFILGLILLAFSGTFDLLIGKFLAYFNRSNKDLGGLHFYNVAKTIREASHISYTVVAHRVSGSWSLFILSGIGYLLMIIRYPVMAISLPSVVIGLLAHKLGLRFTIYAVPFFALGFAYLALLTAEYISRLFIDDKIAKVSKYIVITLFLLGSLYANISHVLVYKTPTTFLKQEVAALDKLSKIASREDYTVTWWDYGYPIRYYAGTKTLIDGGKHSGEVNFPVSFALTRNQVAAANIARLDVEYTDKVEVARELGKKFKTKGFLPDMMKKYGYKDVNDFLNALNNPNFKLPKKTRDIYFYLPFRMADIYPTIAVFSYIDLNTGKVKQPFIIPSSVLGGNNKGVQFANGMWMDMRGMLHIGDKMAPINTFYISTYDKTGKFRLLKQSFNPDSNIYIVWYKPLNKLLIVDKNIFNSTYVQMFFLGNYDKNLFEPVIENPFVRIYKLKK